MSMMPQLNTKNNYPAWLLLAQGNVIAEGMGFRWKCGVLHKNTINEGYFLLFASMAQISDPMKYRVLYEKQIFGMIRDITLRELKYCHFSNGFLNRTDKNYIKCTMFYKHMDGKIDYLYPSEYFPLRHLDISEVKEGSVMSCVIEGIRRAGVIV